MLKYINYNLPVKQLATGWMATACTGNLAKNWIKVKVMDAGCDVTEKDAASGIFRGNTPISRCKHHAIQGQGCATISSSLLHQAAVHASHDHVTNMSSGTCHMSTVSCHITHLGCADATRG